MELPGEVVGPSRRWLWPWDVYLAVSFAALIAVVVSETEAGSIGKTVAAACLGLIAASWFVVGRRSARAEGEEEGRDTAVAVGYVTGVVLTFVVAVAADEISTFALFALCPIAFLCLSLRAALIAVTVLNLVPVPIQLAQGTSVEEIRIDVGIAVLGLVFSALIGTSIDGIARQSGNRARLIAELEESRAEVAALSKRAGAAAERTRLAAEIHDTLAQGFTSIVTLVQAAESELDADRPAAERHLALAVRTAKENLAEARAMVTVLAPADLRANTLADVVRKQVTRLAEETGVTTSCAVEGVPGDLPTAVEVVLVRVLQEALTNVRKHAGASTVTVDLLGGDRGVILTVTDDGAGFDPAHVPGGFGLRGMRARVEQVDGVLAIDSAPTSGTTLTLEVPR